MPRINADGADEVIALLERVGVNSERLAARTLYSGAGFAAERLKAEVMKLPVDDNAENRKHGGLNVISTEDREDLANGVGISTFENKAGELNTKISVDGYTRRTERDYPKGVPLPMLARSIESGSSVRRKHPFIRPAANAMKDELFANMSTAAHAEMTKIIEEDT